MNVDQFKNPLCYLCLGGDVLSSLSLTQEVVGSSLHLKLNVVSEFAEFSGLQYATG